MKVGCVQVLSRIVLIYPLLGKKRAMNLNSTFVT